MNLHVVASALGAAIPPMSRRMALVVLIAHLALAGELVWGQQIFTDTSRTYSMWVTNAGNAGIGIQTPTAVLQVSGDFIVSTSAQTTSPSLYVGTDGNVGIGTATPTYKLQVQNTNGFAEAAIQGSASGDTGLRISDADRSWKIGVNVGGSGAGKLNIYDLSGGGNRLTIDSNGNVGIATTNPTARLDVYGTISATHFVGDGSGLTGLASSGDKIVSGTTNVSVNGNHTISFTTNGSVANYVDASGRLVTTGISVTTNQLSATTGYFSGNVGIGTTAPAGMVDVLGSNPSISIRHNVLNAGTNTLYFSHNGAGAEVQKLAIITQAAGAYSKGSMYFAVNNALDTTSALVSDSLLTLTSDRLVGTSVNFGAGTTYPGDIIEAYGTNPFVRISSGNNTGTSGLRFSHMPAGLATQNKVAILAPSAGGFGRSTGLYFAINNANDNTNAAIGDSKFAILESGNVGIGTASPRASFEVNSGNASGVTSVIANDGTGGSVVSPVYLRQDFAGYAYLSYGPMGRIEVRDRAANYSYSDMSFQVRNNISVLGTVMFLSGLGNVGIGTVTPTTALEVSGTISATHFVGDGSGLTGLASSGDRITSGTTNVTVNGNHTISFTTNGSVANYVDSAGRFVMTGISVTTNQLSATTAYFSGNVGIGMNNPTHALQLGTDDAYKPNGGTWGASSDARFKTNVKPVGDALEKLSRLQGVSFDWKNPALHGGTAASGGFVAQDVAKVFPEFVSSSACVGDDCKLTGNGKAYTVSLPFAFDAYVVEAIKQLKAENDSLRARIQKLEHHHAKRRAVK